MYFPHNPAEEKPEGVFSCDTPMNSCIFIFSSPLFPFSFSSGFCSMFPSRWKQRRQFPVSWQRPASALHGRGSFCFWRTVTENGGLFFLFFFFEIGDWKQIVFSPNIHAHVWLQLMASLEHSVLDKGQWRRCNAPARRAIPQRSVAPHMNAWRGKIIRRVESAKASCFCTPSECVCVCALTLGQWLTTEREDSDHSGKAMPAKPTCEMNSLLSVLMARLLFFFLPS